MSRSAGMTTKVITLNLPAARVLVLSVVIGARVPEAVAALAGRALPLSRLERRSLAVSSA